MKNQKSNGDALGMKKPSGKPSNTKTGKAPRDWKNPNGGKKK